MQASQYSISNLEDICNILYSSTNEQVIII